MAAVYRTLYEKYEQNDVLHVGIQEVVEAEKEIDTFLKSLDRKQRDQLDTLLGRLSRAYEMQGFLFGGLASGAKWNGKTAPEPGDGYGRSTQARGKQGQNGNFLKYFCAPMKDLLLDVPEKETASMG